MAFVNDVASLNDDNLLIFLYQVKIYLKIASLVDRIKSLSNSVHNYEKYKK